jgi:Putative MetA-pathway of phenol degradation
MNWKTHGFTVLSILFLLLPGAASAQPLVTDRPGILFSSLTVGKGVFQTELGLPQVTLNESGGTPFRTTSFVALFRYGVSESFELRLGGPAWTRARTGSGYGDLEVGAKWHLLDNQGRRPSFALIPSVILPTGEDGFTAGDPVYQLNAMAEWTLANGWGIGALAGLLNGPSSHDRYNQETLALAAGRSLRSPVWSAYGEAAYAATGLDGSGDTAFLGGGIKYLVSDDMQFDLSFDRGLIRDSPDWLLGLGLAARF